VGLSDEYNHPHHNCPCAKYPGPFPPAFVGNHYYCEAGDTGTFVNNLYYTTDQLLVAVPFSAIIVARPHFVHVVDV